MKDLSSELSYC